MTSYKINFKTTARQGIVAALNSNDPRNKTEHNKSHYLSQSSVVLFAGAKDPQLLERSHSTLVSHIALNS